MKISLTTVTGNAFRASFLPVFSFLSPYALDLGSGTGLTDGQRDDDHQCIMPHPMAAGA